MNNQLTDLDPADVRIFSGRSNPQLAGDIANQLGIRLEETHFSRFSNDNLFVQLGASVRGRNVYIIQSLTPPVSDHLMELLMMIDIAKGAAAREVHAIIPYFSYARSDKKDAPRISITARLIADLLWTAGATHVMAMNLHSPQVHGFFSVPTDPLTARALFVGYVKEYEFSADEVIVVAPDMGRAGSAARFASQLNLPVATASKERISDKKVKISGLIRRQVKGFKHALIYDDEIATAGSVSELGSLLVRKGGVSKITVICTHGLFLGPAVERLLAIPEIVEIITTDTVPLPPDARLPKMTVLSVAPIFAEAIRRNYLHRSIGDLFTYGHDHT